MNKQSKIYEMLNVNTLHYFHFLRICTCLDELCSIESREQADTENGSVLKGGNFMTNTGIAWLQHKETQRSNFVNEGIKADTLQETKRSNLANEGIKTDTLNETRRANLAQEALKVRAQDETERSNLTREVEQERTNRANEAIKVGALNETARSNRAKEEISQFANYLRSEELDLSKQEFSEAQANNVRKYIGSLIQYLGDPVTTVTAQQVINSTPELRQILGTYGVVDTVATDLISILGSFLRGIRISS